jgi:DNA repair exonuclease SbcCD ATPase subunit
LNRLLERITELEEFQRLVRTENDQLSDRIEELEKELQTNQQSWQEHDRGRIFSAKEMQLRIAELETLIKVAAGGGREICPRCNQEMGSPHYCRPDWSGPSIGDKEISNE